MSTFEKPRPSALQHHHHPLRFPVEADGPAFQAMLALWYSAADVLKLKPAGTLGRLPGGGWLVMAPLSGELFLFESPDIDQAGEDVECSLIRPQDMHEIGIGRQEFEQYGRDLAEWLRAPVYGESVAPEQIAQVVIRQFAGDTIAEWSWSGVQ